MVMPFDPKQTFFCIRWRCAGVRYDVCIMRQDKPDRGRDVLSGFGCTYKPECDNCPQGQSIVKLAQENETNE
jgi:hypothetical protein